MVDESAPGESHAPDIQGPSGQVGETPATDDDVAALRAEVEALAAEEAPDPDAARSTVAALRAALREGRVRAAERTRTGWQAVEWVKAGILLAFRVGQTREFEPFARGPNRAFDGSPMPWFDRNTLPLRPTRGEEQNVRIVPGGTSIRDGAYVASDVVLMPPAFVNIGAWIGEGAMIDSHALVGSCAQVGRRVHLSAGAQLGGVLEPVGLRPVIVEEEVLVGGNAGVFEGTLVGRRAVIGPGVQLTRSTPVHDLVRKTVHRATAEEPLAIPDGAVVVPGSRPAAGGFAEARGLQLYVPVIVKYRDESTDAATALEEALR